MISSSSVRRFAAPAFGLRARPARPSGPIAAVVLVSAGISGAFGGCSGGSRDTDLVLRLAPDSTCAAAPVGCVDELVVTLTDLDGAPRGSWTLDFDVESGTASLGDVPRSGTGTFSALGRATENAVAPVIVFSGESAPITLEAGKNQEVVVPVSCNNVPDPCANASPTPTPNPFATFPIGHPADTLIGQAAFDVCAENAIGIGNGRLMEPDGLFLTSTQLWVADRNLGRLSVFNRSSFGMRPVPVAFTVGHTTNGEPGNGSSDDDFDRPRGVLVDTASGLAFVADQNNHRVQIFDPLPTTTNDPNAALVLGQSNPGNSAQNAGGPDFGSLNAPWSVVGVPGQGLFVSDTDNNRVLHYNLPIAANQQLATATCGQANDTSIAANRGGTVARNSMSGPAHIATDGTRLYLADRLNNRVLVWNDAATAAAGGDPDFVLGQATFTENAPNRGGAPAADTLSGPRGVAASERRLVVVDSDNHRVLIWQPPPTVDGEPADSVLGQASFTTNAPNPNPTTGGNCPGTNTCPALNNGRPRDATLFRPGAAWEDGDQLYVSDTCNNRVVRYTAVPPL